MTEPDAESARLRAAGIPVDALSAEQREVLATLSDEELDTLLKVGDRMKAAALPIPIPSVGVFYY